MARALHSTNDVARRGVRGFTLVEMMIVVVIVGVLATLAVVGYRKLIESSRVSEATGMVQSIRVAQESYHSETQQYANISTSLTSWYPQAPVHDTMMGWGAPCGGACTAVTWQMLPLHVDGPVIFGYATVAGPANSPTPGTLSVNGTQVQLPVTSPTDWYVIAAEADLDSDPSTTTDVYGTSWTNQVWVSNDGQ